MLNNKGSGEPVKLLAYTMALDNDTDQNTGAGPGFLERGFICKKVWGFALLILSNFFYKISHENEMIWSLNETKLLNFHGIFNKNWAGWANPLWIRH